MNIYIWGKILLRDLEKIYKIYTILIKLKLTSGTEISAPMTQNSIRRWTKVAVKAGKEEYEGDFEAAEGL